jgi:uncharacterized membrane protein YdbT with pleckstrin-like domain
MPLWRGSSLRASTLCSAVLAADRARALGHRVDERWLVARAGSLERRRDCIATAGIIGWTVRQTLFQRRAGVATLVAATAAGVKDTGDRCASGARMVDRGRRHRPGWPTSEWARAPQSVT